MNENAAIAPELAHDAPALAVDLGGLRMKNPVTDASGTFGSGREYADFFDVARLGAITTKGVSFTPWEGNPTPRIAETPSGMLNSIGLQNPGVEAFCENTLPWLAAQASPPIRRSPAPRPPLLRPKPPLRMPPIPTRSSPLAQALPRTPRSSSR